MQQNPRGNIPGALCSHLTLQSVGVLGAAQPHVLGQSRVAVEQLPVLLLTDQRLRPPGMHQVHHIQRQLELRPGVLETLLVFHLSNEKQITQISQQSN